MNQQNQTIAWIGTGVMGAAMAGHLLTGPNPDIGQFEKYLTVLVGGICSIVAARVAVNIAIKIYAVIDLNRFLLVSIILFAINVLGATAFRISSGGSSGGNLIFIGAGRYLGEVLGLWLAVRANSSGQDVRKVDSRIGET